MTTNFTHMEDQMKKTETTRAKLSQRSDKKGMENHRALVTSDAWESAVGVTSDRQWHLLSECDRLSMASLAP